MRTLQPAVQCCHVTPRFMVSVATAFAAGKEVACKEDETPAQAFPSMENVSFPTAMLTHPDLDLLHQRCVCRAEAVPASPMSP